MQACELDLNVSIGIEQTTEDRLENNEGGDKGMVGIVIFVLSRFIEVLTLYFGFAACASNCLSCSVAGKCDTCRQGYAINDESTCTGKTNRTIQHLHAT